MHKHTYKHVTLSHLRSKEPPGLHFLCSPANRATYEMYYIQNVAGIQLGSDYIAKIDCGDRLIHM